MGVPDLGLGTRLRGWGMGLDKCHINWPRDRVVLGSFFYPSEFGIATWRFG